MWVVIVFFGWVATFALICIGCCGFVQLDSDERPVRALDMPQALQQQLTFTAVYMVTEYRDHSEIKRQKRVGWKDCIQNQLQF